MMRSIALELKVIVNIGHELVTYGAVQHGIHMDRRLFPHAGKAIVITAGDASERFNRDPQTGSLQRMDERPRDQQMMREAAGFIVPDIFRKGTVMAENNVAELAGQGALDKV